MSGFYIGYIPKTSVEIAKFVHRVLIALFLAIVTLGAVLVTNQQQFPAAIFEWNTVRSFQGTIETKPYPTLVVRRPGITSAGEQYSRYLLVGIGKHGADASVAGFDGRSAELKGKLIYRDGATVIEVMPGTVHASADTPSSFAVGANGSVTVTGEIVDSKCYSGVMNPGRGKVHRDCAVRCLSGGAPPVLVETAGEGRLFVLATVDGGALPKPVFLDRVAEPVRVRGQALRLGDQLQLRVEKIARVYP